MKIFIRKLIFICIGFILFTIIGTISHEYGHILTAKYLGYETTLHYASMNYDNSEYENEIIEIYNQNKVNIANGNEFKDKVKYEEGVKKLSNDALLIRIGGPLQTITTGIIGLIVVSYRRKKINRYGLKFFDWLAVFLSLFWLREVFNLFMSIISGLIDTNGSYFGGDEKVISELLNLWEGTFSCILGVIGIVISIFVVFRVVKQPLRLTFITGGFLGGVLGFILWMNFLGPILLP